MIDIEIEELEPKTAPTATGGILPDQSSTGFMDRKRNLFVSGFMD